MALIIEAAPALPVFKTFHYLVPAELEEDIQPGLRVLIPVGLRTVTGYVLGTVASSDRPELKEILDILDERPLFPPGLLRLFEWMARYYHYPLGKVIESALPAGLNVSSRRLLILTGTGQRALAADTHPPEGGGHLRPECKEKNISQEILSVLSLFRGEKPVAVPAIEKIFPGAGRHLIPGLVDKGLLAWKEVVERPRTRLKEERMVRLTGKASEKPLSGDEEAILTYLREQGEVPVKRLGASMPHLTKRWKKLEKTGLISFSRAIIYRDPFSAEGFWYRRPATLTAEQKQAVEDITRALSSHEFSAHVLHGVTASGKTEVYLRAAEAALAQGKDCIILVPEIALTAYLEAAFISCFGDKVAVLHSALSPGEKFDQWLHILEGKARIVIGARSAVFAPLSSLGLIVVDEEHDSSYKQEDKLRYHGRDVAVMRGRLEKAVVILGSATPSIQSVFNVKSGRYGYLALTRRVEERALPEVSVIDMRSPGSQTGAGRAIFFPELLDAIEDNLQKKEQTLIFLNRRGYSPSMQCNSCGQVLICPNCSVSLTHHLSEQTLLCHYCGYSVPALPACPACGGINVRSIGWGTERIEAELKTLFSEARIARLDRDTTTRKRAHHGILRAVQKREIDILVGTQMVTKGHDFPYITLVGVISADLSLNLPDFRAAEKTFQLLAQVAGRAGRGERPGKVIIQTYNPDHYSIIKAKQHDFPGYYEEEIALRRALGYPPFVRLINLLLESNSQIKVKDYAREMSLRAHALLQKNMDWLDTVEILGPAPAPLFKIRGKFRYQMFLKGLKVGPLHAYTNGLLEYLKAKPPVSGVKLIIDVDPESML
ncbi:MAG: primosomal protein N' [Desulfovibrionales bacterium]|nr:primosomal protein N' [Desulfovibrionales bacterium]